MDRPAILELQGHRSNCTEELIELMAWKRELSSTGSYGRPRCHVKGTMSFVFTSLEI